MKQWDHKDVYKRQIESSISCTLRGTKGISRGGSALQYYRKFLPEIPDTQTIDFFEKKDYYDRFGNGSHHAGEYQNYIEYFARCLDQGITPKPDLTEGIRTLAVMEAIERSIKTHEMVRVSQILQEKGLEGML